LRIDQQDTQIMFIICTCIALYPSLCYDKFIQFTVRERLKMMQMSQRRR